MSNLIGSGSGSSGNNYSGGGGSSGGALIAIPLIVVASFSLKSGVLEGCGRQAGKHIDEFVPTRIERNPNQYLQPYTPTNKTYDPFSYDPNPVKNWENPEKDYEKEIGDQIKDLGKDGLEYILEPKDTTKKNNP